MFIKNNLPYILIFFITLSFTSSIFENITNTGRGDWDPFCFFSEAPRTTIIKFYQFPLWNPYASGGRPLLANPQVDFLGPTFILTILFGCVIGLKLKVFIVILIAMMGMFLLSRQYQINKISAILSAVIFGLSGYFSLRIVEGHIALLTFALMPFILLFYLKSNQHLCNKYSILTAACISLVIFEAGSGQVLPPILIFLSIYAFVQSLQKKSFTPISALFIILLLVMGITAIKAIPTLELLTTHQRNIDTNDEKMTVKGLYYGLLYRQQNWRQNMFEGQRWDWHEYGSYFGIFALLLFLFGVFIFWKRELPLLVSGSFMLIVSLGNIHPLAPWNLLHLLPFIRSTHVPSRQIILFVFVVAIFAALAFDYLWKECKKNHFRRVVLIAILVFIIIDLFMVNRPPISQAFTIAPQKISWRDNFQQIVDQNYSRSGCYSSMFYNLQENSGTLNADDPIPYSVYPVAKGDPDYLGEVYLLSPGNAYYQYWSPNKLIINVSSKEQTRLVINQNYATGWRVAGNKKAEPHNGLLSVNVTSKDSIVEFYYLPHSFIIGVAITIATILGIIFYWKKLKD